MALDLSSLGRVNTTLALNRHAAQAMSFRIILQILQSMASRPNKFSDIKSLELTGIAPVSVNAVTSSKIFREVMEKLKHLRLGFDDWYDITHTRRTITDTPTHVTSHSFMESLVLSCLDKNCSCRLPNYIEAGNLDGSSQRLIPYLGQETALDYYLWSSVLPLHRLREVVQRVAQPRRIWFL